MNMTREQVYGWAGSLSIGGLILLFLLFAVLRSAIPNQEEGGVLVNFGYVDEAAGMFEPEGDGTVSAAPPISTPAPSPSTPSRPTSAPSPEELITQNIEESAALSEAQKKANEQKAEEERIRKKEERKRREEEQRRQNISNQVSGAFGTASSNSPGIASSSPGTSQGTGSGTGNQGSPFGNSDQGLNSGIGGYGSFSLSGRNIGREGLPRPSYSIPESGVIVVNITVSPAGDVIATSIGRGTTIDNSTMRDEATKAAQKAKFNRIDGLNNQLGTITYRYQLN